jgi:nitrous oxide reductase
VAARCAVHAESNTKVLRRDEDMSDKTPFSGRRRFLKTAAMAGGAAGVAAVTGVSVAETLQPAGKAAAPAAPAAKGYHVTPHIEAYYRLARQ